jgi:expansin (peptidoglycan-binding protein)
MNETFGLGCLVISALALAMPLGGCDTAETGDAPCASNADCALGQICNVGTCVASGAPLAGAGGGSNAGSGQGGGVNPSAGAAAQAGNGSGGNSSTGGSVASAGAGGSGNGNAGSSAQGGASGGGTGGSGASGGGNTPSQCKDDFWPGANSGSVTRYDFKQGTSLPACSYVITHTGSGSDGDWDTVEGIATGDGGYFGAMNTTDYAQGAACGACVEASYSGRKVVLTIVDECPVSTNPLCTKGHIDLSRKAIRQLEPNGSLENLKNVSWRYVKCPASGNVKTRLHPNQNPDWQPVVIENGLFPLKSVTLNGTNAMRTGNDSGGNAWIATGQKTPYTVRATDVNNGTITFSYGDSGLKDVGEQFTCQ